MYALTCFAAIVEKYYLKQIKGISLHENALYVGENNHSDHWLVLPAGVMTVMVKTAEVITADMISTVVITSLVISAEVITSVVITEVLTTTVVMT